MTKHDILLDVQHVSHVFPLTKQVSVKALDDVSFQIRRGEIFGLVGESGSGKSTAARYAMGILQPSGGHIFYNGVDLCDKGRLPREQKNAANHASNDLSGLCLEPRPAHDSLR